MSTIHADARHAGQGGFALLVSLIAIVGLTALATGGFLLANSERRVSSNHHAVVEAFYLANAGLNDYLGNQSGEPPTGPTTYGPYSYPGGSASVTVTRVSTTGGATDPGLYRITSEGRYDPNGTGNPVTRTVSTVTLADYSVLPKPPGAITSGGGVQKQGTSGEINGNDECGVESAVSGVRVPVDGYEQSGGEEGDVVFGDPPVEETTEPLDFDGDGTTDDEAEWWQGVLDGSNIQHDHVVEDGDGFPDTSGEDMPVTYVDQDSYSVGRNESGQGLLIVRGNVNFGGGFDWDGIILVGGTVTDNGIGEINGGVMTGLNSLIDPNWSGTDDLDNDTNDDDTLDGTKKFLFHSCNVEDVMKSTAVLAELPGTWHERL